MNPMLARVLPLFLLTPLSAQAEDLDEVGAWLGEAFGTKVHDLQPREVPSELLARVAAVAELDPDDLATAEAYTGRVMVRSRMVPVRITRIPDWSQDHWAAIAGDENGTIRGFAWTDLEGRVLAPWDTLARQMVGRHELPSIERARTREALQETRARAAAGEGEDARTVHALFSLRDAMMTQDVVLEQVNDALHERPGSDPDKAADAMRDHFQKLHDLAEALQAEMGDAATAYRETATAAITLSEELRELLRNGGSDSSGVKAHENGMRGLCGDCHRARPGSERGGLMSHMAATRARYGIGNDYFVIGYDLYLQFPEEDSQQVADWLWYAGLIASGL